MHAFVIITHFQWPDEVRTDSSKHQLYLVHWYSYQTLVVIIAIFVLEFDIQYNLLYKLQYNGSYQYLKVDRRHVEPCRKTFQFTPFYLLFIMYTGQIRMRQKFHEAKDH